MTVNARQRYFAEFVGTFVLLLFGGGAAVFTMHGGDLLSRTVVVASAFGFALVALAFVLGDVSGAHFNPAVTISMALSRRMPSSEVAPYIVAQLLGGLVGIAVVAGIVAGSPSGFATAQENALGSQCFSGWGAPSGCGYSLASVFLLELALTFVFVLAIQLVTRPESGAGKFAPLVVGLSLVGAIMVAFPVDGASLNPVRSFAPAVLSIAWSSGQWAIAESWLFWLAPILGGVLASFVERLFRPGAETTPAAAHP